jgi:hypothetical protein
MLRQLCMYNNCNGNDLSLLDLIIFCLTAVDGAMRGHAQPPPISFPIRKYREFCMDNTLSFFLNSIVSGFREVESVER